MTTRQMDSDVKKDILVVLLLVGTFAGAFPILVKS